MFVCSKNKKEVYLRDGRKESIGYVFNTILHSKRKQASEASCTECSKLPEYSETEGQRTHAKKANWYKHVLGRFVISMAFISIIFGSTVTIKPKHAYALSLCIPCPGGCNPVDLALTGFFLYHLKKVWTPIIEKDIKYIINREYHFLNDRFYKDFWIRAVKELTEYLSAYGLYQVQMVGAFFDAKNQLETTRLLFKLQAEAHKDYHVSEDFCWIGTNSRSLAASESRARLNQLVMAKFSIDRQLGTQGTASSIGIATDKTGRWDQFVDTFCDQKDNGWEGMGTGLELACDHDGRGANTVFGAKNRSKVNLDLDYTRLIEIPRTIDVNFTDSLSSSPSPNSMTIDEQAIMALSSNLYGNIASSRLINYETMNGHRNAQSLYMDQRTVIARRGIAQNSFNAIVAMKSAGTSGHSSGANTAYFLATILKELMPANTTDSEVYEILGQNPSYYAQLEMLSKKIYQNPKFFAKLYDTPANVLRKSVAMKAIELMVDRALLESELRQEMLLSVMLSTDLDQNFRRVNASMERGKEK